MGGYGRFVVGKTSWNSSTSESEFHPLFHVHSDGNVLIGTPESFSPTYKLEVNGTIRAKEVRVESGWADFVFKDDYKLPTLQEVKAHISEHKHLPGMPSETEVQENGIGLADATTKLLQKVEELTLYVIQQNEQSVEQQKTINQLKDKIAELEAGQK